MSENDLRLNKEKAKKMMLLFALLSITMTFGGLTSAYVVSKGRPDWLVDFTLPQSFIYSTFVIILSSVTIQLSKFFLNKGKSKNWVENLDKDIQIEIEKEFNKEMKYLGYL